MLVLSRKRGEWVLAVERGTNKLVAKVSVLPNQSTYALSESQIGVRLGFDFGPEVLLVRHNTTGIKDWSYDRILRLPLGTVIPLS